MDELQLEPLSGMDMDRYSDWFGGGATDIIASPMFDNSSISIGGGSHTMAWKVLQAKEVVAIITISVDNGHVGHLNIAVRRDVRRQGIGSKTVALITHLPEVQELSGLSGAVPRGNTAAEKILIKNGFSRIGASPDGKLEFRWRPEL